MELDKYEKIDQMDLCRNRMKLQHSQFNAKQSKGSFELT